MSPRLQTKKKYESDAPYKGLVNLAGAMLIAYWRLYPDRALAFLESEKSTFSFAPVQCMVLRAEAREQEVFITGGRGSGKSLTGLANRIIMGVLYPGISMPYFGPTLKQTAEIMRNAYSTLSINYPALLACWRVTIDNSDRFAAATSTGSTIDVDAMRGMNAHTVFCEEVAQQEKGEPFDHERFRTVVLPGVRIQRLVRKKLDTTFPNFQKAYVTSAGRKQNSSYTYRTDIMQDMTDGKRAFAMDIPGEVVVLNGIRLLDWYMDLRRKLTPEEWLREMGSRWIGASEHPIVRDSTLSESKQESLMENRHCGDPDVTYIVSYDVSYSEHAKSAKCALVVLKCEEQGGVKRDRFRKTVVYVKDEDASEYRVQAQHLKDWWNRFSLETGRPTYIAIDSRSYGHSVLECLHKDLQDGLPPLCCVRHECKDLELDGALPVIYPINATGGYVTDNDDRDNENEMLRYAEVEWEQRNVRLLISNVNEGVNAYKAAHRIRDDESDAEIALPYIKCRELAWQISNLKKRIAGAGFKEERVSNSINRDMWSATKYALRIAQRLEMKAYKESIIRSNPWTEHIKSGAHSQIAKPTERIVRPHGVLARSISRTGGNRRFT